jgi:hypothetical protein
MRRARLIWTIPLALAGFVSVAQVEVAVVQSRDGSTARITDLGNGIGMITDPHDSSRPLVLPSTSVIDQAGPHGDVTPKAVVPFGAAAPPNCTKPLAWPR